MFLAISSEIEIFGKMDRRKLLMDGYKTLPPAFGLTFLSWVFIALLIKSERFLASFIDSAYSSIDSVSLQIIKQKNAMIPVEIVPLIMTEAFSLSS